MKQRHPRPFRLPSLLHLWRRHTRPSSLGPCAIVYISEPLSSCSILHNAYVVQHHHPSRHLHFRHSLLDLGELWRWFRLSALKTSPPHCPLTTPTRTPTNPANPPSYSLSAAQTPWACSHYFPHPVHSFARRGRRTVDREDRPDGGGAHGHPVAAGFSMRRHAPLIRLRAVSFPHKLSRFQLPAVALAIALILLALDIALVLLILSTSVLCAAVTLVPTLLLVGCSSCPPSFSFSPAYHGPLMLTFALVLPSWPSLPPP
jgi:hypothetical protein